MAVHLLFVILMISSHKLQVQAVLPPTLTVNTAVISEADSVSLRCRAPASPPADQCYFYTGEQQSVKGVSCLQTLTAAELLFMSGLTLPADVKVRCFYTVKYGDVKSSSPHSNQLSITIQSQKPEISAQRLDEENILIVCSLPGSVKDDTRCNLYFGEAGRPALNQSVGKKSSSKTKRRSCHFYVKVADFSRLHSVHEKDFSCDYSLQSEANSLSPRSDRYDFKGHPDFSRFIVSTATTALSSSSGILEKESVMTSRKSSLMNPGNPSFTSSTVSTTTTSLSSSSGVLKKEKRTVTSTKSPFINPAELRPTTRSTTCSPSTASTSSTSVSGRWNRIVAFAVVGFGVTMVIVLLILKLVRSKRRAERYSPKWTKANTTDNFVCVTNINHGRTLLQSNDGAYSEITSVPGVRCITGAEKQNGEEIRRADPDIYHVYATISEEPAVPASQDMIYSMLQAQ